MPILWAVPSDCGLRESVAVAKLAKAIYDAREEAYGAEMISFANLTVHQRQVYIQQAQDILRANRPYRGHQ